MIHEKIDIRGEGSGEDAVLYTYILDITEDFYEKKRPLILVCPGGGYGFCSDREGEMIAMQFNAMGYHAAVLYYSVAPSRFPAAVLELGRAVSALRSRAEEWHIDAGKIGIAGFSAGGHVAASYCMFWNREWMTQALLSEPEQRKPNAMILGYPVITSGTFAHRDSFCNLLGEAYEEKKEEMSLENQISSAVPRTFVWHTFEDNVVPVQNSLLLVNGLVKQGIPVEFHMFQKGGHGLSLANRMTKGAGGFGEEPSCQCWIQLLHTWLEEEWSKEE